MPGPPAPAQCPDWPLPDQASALPAASERVPRAEPSLRCCCEFPTAPAAVPPPSTTGQTPLAFLHVHVHVCVCVCAFVHACVRAGMCISVCVSVRMSVCGCVSHAHVVSALNAGRSNKGGMSKSLVCLFGAAMGGWCVEERCL